MNEPMLNAAHQRTDMDAPEDIDTSDDDIMDDENVKDNFTNILHEIHRLC